MPTAVSEVCVWPRRGTGDGHAGLCKRFSVGCALVGSGSNSLVKIAAGGRLASVAEWIGDAAGCVRSSGVA